MNQVWKKKILTSQDSSIFVETFNWCGIAPNNYESEQEILFSFRW